MNSTSPMDIKISKNFNKYEIGLDYQVPPPPLDNTPPKDNIYQFSSILEKISDNSMNCTNYKKFKYRNRYN